MSELFLTFLWKKFGTDEIGKEFLFKLRIKNSVFFLANLPFKLELSANWESFKSIEKFFSQLGKNWHQTLDPVLYR